VKLENQEEAKISFSRVNSISLSVKNFKKTAFYLNSDEDLPQPGKLEKVMKRITRKAVGNPAWADVQKPTGKWVRKKKLP